MSPHNSSDHSLLTFTPSRTRTSVLLMEYKVHEKRVSSAKRFHSVDNPRHCANALGFSLGHYLLPWHGWPVHVASSCYTPAISFFRVGYLRGALFTCQRLRFSPLSLFDSFIFTLRSGIVGGCAVLKRRSIQTVICTSMERWWTEYGIELLLLLLWGS